VVGLIIFSIATYLSIPAFFNFEKSKMESVICKDFKIKCSIQGKINYSFFPSPRIKLKDFIIHVKNLKIRSLLIILKNLSMK